MKLLTSLALTVPLLASSAYGHYIFQFLTANGSRGAQYQYIRRNTNYNSPVTDLGSPDLRCNVGGASGSSTETVEVRAGSSISFTSDTAVYHQGPTCVYMSRAPSTAASYDGSGQWFKIREWGSSGGCQSWTLSSTYTFNLPSSLPNGEYLLRIEQLAVHNPWPAGIPQFYISCAQIRVTGGGSGSPNPTVSIPGHVRQSDPGYTANIYNQCSSYTVPGPRVWSG